MSAAIALSAALHVFLIYGFSLSADPGPGVRVTVIRARLMSPQPAASARRARLPERLGPPDFSRPAPVALSQPESSAAAELSAVPTPTTTPIDPEPVVPAGNDAAIATIPDPVHYPAKDLDIYPQALRRITPVYPETARDAQVAGAVTLLVLIDEVGKVVGTSVMDAAPDGVFEEAAQQALANAMFYPAQKDGRMVRSRVLIKVEFDPELTGAAQ
ncbi:MAG: energy transducer TonB [Betaproteobacteria bacterium]|nr:energy transducer TonB [Betaproteobacteria bacterium]